MTSALHSEAIYKSEDGLLRSDKVNRDQGSYQQDIPEWFKAYAERQDKILEQQNTILTQLAGKSSVLRPRLQSKRGPCFQCGEMGHFKNQCIKGSKSQKPCTTGPLKQGN